MEILTKRQQFPSMFENLLSPLIWHELSFILGNVTDTIQNKPYSIPQMVFDLDGH